MSESVGSAAEEAAKLLAALKDVSRGVGGGVGHGADCRYCPVCQVINVVRDASPELRDHVTEATAAILKAAQSFFDAPARSDDQGAAEGPPAG